MNFFHNQDLARRNTLFLLLGFVLSIALIIALIDVAVYYFYPDPRLLQNMSYVNLAIAVTIFVGSLHKYFKLRGGGKALVETLNAMPVPRSTSDPKFITLNNVVDEISIAAGIAAPLVFVMPDELGINAFVAGYNPNDTVLVVTQGALDNLSRDELQGVIAHEYSHIFNSDTTLNLRILIIIAGLFMISQVGYIMMRTRGDRKGNLVLIGLAVFLIGYLGVFFGSILKAAISRQRESLADASSVQYTRNPKGITIALLKISDQGKQALMQDKAATDVNHMCFSTAQTMTFTDLFATHPKLETRIAELDPTGEITADFINNKNKFKASANSDQNQTKSKKAPAPAPDTLMMAAMAVAVSGGGAANAITGQQIIESIGNPSSASFEHAENILNSIPPEIKHLLDTPEEAEALMYAMLIEVQHDIDWSKLDVSESIKSQIKDSLNYTQISDPTFRSALIDLATPTLKQLDQSSTEKFLNNCYELAKADQKLTCFKAVMLTILTQRLNINAFKNIKPKYSNYSDVSTEISCILWYLAQQGAANIDEQRQAFTAAIKHMTNNSELNFEDLTFKVHDLVNSLTRLRLMKPTLKEQFLQACVICTMQDKQVSAGEIELLRAVCSCLDCPVPVLKTS